MQSSNEPSSNEQSSDEPSSNEQSSDELSWNEKISDELPLDVQHGDVPYVDGDSLLVISSSMMIDFS